MTTAFQEAVIQAFEDELEKIAQIKSAISKQTMKTVGLIGAGAVGTETLRRANNDRKMGRIMRIQQGQQGY